MRPRSSAVYVIPSVVVLLIVGLHWAQVPTVVAQIDLPPPFDPANMLRKCAFAWADVHTYFGSVDNCGSWYPYTGLLLFFDAIFGPSYGQALVFTSTVVLSWLGAYACARAMGAAAPAAFLAGWMYAFNPARQLMFGEFATGEVCAALLVWVIYWIIVAAREPGRRRAARASIAAIAFAALVVLAGTPQLLVELVVGSLAVLGFAYVRWAQDQKIFGSWILGTLGVAVVASLWWTVPNAVSFVGVAITHPVAPMSVAWTFARASLLNELRFCASWVWQFAEYNPWSIEFEHNLWLYASGFAPVAALIVALIACRGERLATVRFFGALALVMLFVAKGVHPPLVQANLAFYSLPGMFMFIEPYGAVLIAAAGLSVCAALGADALMNSSVMVQRRLGGAFVAVSVALLAWNNLAAVTGAIFHEKMNFTPDEHIALPWDWQGVTNFLNASTEPGGVAVLPPDDHYQADYSWGYRGIDMIALELFHRDVLMPGATFWYTQSPSTAQLDAAISRLVAIRSPLAKPLLSDLGIRYVVARLDVHPVTHGSEPVPMEYRRIFGREAAVYGDLEIYDLGPATASIARIPENSSFDGDAGDIESLRAAGITGRPYENPVRRSAILGELHPATTIRTIALSELDAVADISEIPRVVGRTPTESTTLVYDVFNPGGAIAADVWIGVWPRVPTQYSLSHTGWPTLTVEVDTTRVAGWCVFRGVSLAPGMNHLTLREPRTFDRTFAAFMPPRYEVDQPWAPHVGEMTFGYQRDKQFPTHMFGSVANHRIRTTGARVEIPLSRDPRVTIEWPRGSSPTTTGWRIVLSGTLGDLACFDTIAPGLQLDLADSVRDCIAGPGTGLGANTEPPHLTVEQLEPVRLDGRTPAFDGSIDLASSPLPVPDPKAQPTTTADVRPLEVPVLIRWMIPGLAAEVETGEAGNAPLVLAQTYSPTWMAIDIGAPRIAPHREVLGWRNAWDTEDYATVLVFNWLSVLELVLLACGIVVVTMLWVRRR